MNHFTSFLKPLSVSVTLFLSTAKAVDKTVSSVLPSCSSRVTPQFQITPVVG